MYVRHFFISDPMVTLTSSQQEGCVFVGLKPILYSLFWTFSGISPANRSRSGPKSVHMHRSRADNVARGRPGGAGP